VVTVDAVVVMVELFCEPYLNLKPNENQHTHAHNSTSSAVPSSAITILFCFRLQTVGSCSSGEGLYGKNAYMITADSFHDTWQISVCVHVLNIDVERHGIYEL
jgi:hypothetical protein